MLDKALEYLGFLMASAGAAAIVKVLVTRTDFLRDTWVNNKPFSCPLCMGFYWGGVFSILAYGLADGWFWVLYRAFQAAAFSWFFNWKITGED